MGENYNSCPYFSILTFFNLNYLFKHKKIRTFVAEIINLVLKKK